MKLDHNFSIITTQDGSPSLQETDDTGLSENMHSQQGAFTESQIIYGRTIQLGLEKISNPKILILGLGLGYIELITSSLSIQYSQKIISRITSYESNTSLSKNLLLWLNNKPSYLTDTYNQILNLCSQHYQVSKQLIVQNLKKWYNNGTWQIHPTPSLDVKSPHNILLYDAYSPKMTQHLWTEEYLKNFLNHHQGTPCLFRTYAANGNLKRSLKACNFQVIPTTGFAMKRESTFAVYGDL